MRRTKQTQGQALVEFALIATVLLMIIFIIIEASHILWSWITVQSAAREGIRYAITGQADDQCATADLTKFDHFCGDSDDFRVASIIDRTHQGLTGLNLNETSGIFEDDNYYIIEVWGVDSNNQLQGDFGGVPGKPVVIRVIYRVPILTPLLKPILPSIPVFGQVVQDNEWFGQFSNAANQGQGGANNLPQLPTPGVTPSPTNTPTSTPTNTPGISPTPTNTATWTPTPTEVICPNQFEGAAIEGRTSVFVTGEPNTTVRIIDLTTGATLGEDDFIAVPGHACEGFADFNGVSGDPDYLDPALVGGHVIMAENLDNGTFDTTFVQLGTFTPTPTSTSTPAPTSTSTSTPTPSLTPTPIGPWVELFPDCGNPPTASFSVTGGSWPTNEDLFFYWNDPVSGDSFEDFISAPHSGSFSRSWTMPVITNTTYLVKVGSTTTNPYPSNTINASFTVPCPFPPTPTPGPTDTPTPAPEDLIIVGPPVMISTPPIVAYQPVQFSFTISNTGDVDIAQLFFVDLFIDPGIPVPSGTISIPLSLSDGFTSISALAGRTSRVVTVTSQLGFTNTPENHLVYGMVDSVEQINEIKENNNISTPFPYAQVTPADTPTPSPTPDGNDSISGIVYVRITNWVPAYRASVTLIDSSSNPVAQMFTDSNGFYQFTGIPVDTYTVTACYELDGDYFFGNRTGISPPDPLVNIFMLQGPCS